MVGVARKGKSPETRGERLDQHDRLDDAPSPWPGPCSTARSIAPSGSYASRRAASDRRTAGQRFVPSPHIAGHVSLAGDADEGGREPVVALAMNRRSETHDRRADADASQRQGEQGSGRPAPGGVGPDLGTRDEPVVLAGHAAGRQADHARGEHEVPIGTCQGATHSLHVAAVGGAGGGEVAGEGQHVRAGQVDHPVGVGGRLGQGLRIIEVALLDHGARGLQLLRRRLGAGQSDHIMASAEQLGDDRRADPARCAGDKDSHCETSREDVNVSDCPRHICDGGDCQH